MIIKLHLYARSGLISSVLALLLSGFACAGSDDAMGLLEGMSAAADKLDYSGEFVYVSNGKISSMEVAHIGATKDNGSQQKLMALDGSMREIIQQEDIVACVLPDQGMGLREKRQTKQFFSLNLSDKSEMIGQYYTLNHQGATRVANRDCDIVTVIPRDAYRYGYSLCIDSEKQLLLSSELIDLKGDVLESYRFIRVSFDRVVASDISSRTPPKTLDWVDDNPGNSTIKMSSSDAQKKWRVRDNPAGFELQHYIKRISPILQASVTHLVLGDGLAQVSVFVSPEEASTIDSKASMSMGSINSFTRKVDGFAITAVGEVPKATVMLIAKHAEAY